MPVAEFGAAIGVMQVDDNVGGVEQYDQVLCEVGNRIDLQIGITQQHGAGLGDAEQGADDREIDILQILRLAHTGYVAVARDLRHGEHTILAPAIFARTGAKGSPEVGGSRNIPPIRCRLSLKAASSDAGGLSSNNGTTGSDRSTRGKFRLIEAMISSRLLIVSLRDWPDAKRGRSASAGAAPRGAGPRHRGRCRSPTSADAPTPHRRRRSRRDRRRAETAIHRPPSSRSAWPAASRAARRAPDATRRSARGY